MENKRILIVVSKYYKEISAGLLKSTIDTLNNYREGNNNIINLWHKEASTHLIVFYSLDLWHFLASTSSNCVLFFGFMTF